MHFLNRFLIVVSATALSCNSAQAQIIPDTTLGNESSALSPGRIVRGSPAELIEGGAIRVGNLFHSFLDFNIDSGQRVYFASPDGIESILSRVIGGNVSSLAGTLGVDGTADLFLLNPNGIVFADTATLDIDGSFHATTGAEIALGDGVFSAIQPVQSQLLAVSPSTAFSNYLNDNSGNIVSQGNLQPGGDLALAANQIEINGILAAGNNVSLLATSELEINNSFVTLSANEQADPERTLLFQGQNIAVADSTVITGLSGQGSLGNILFIADGDVDMRATANNRFFLGSFVNMDGTAGDLAITAANLRIVDEDPQTDGVGVFVGAIGIDGGSGGDVTIAAQDTILLDGIPISAIAAGQDQVGSAGDIRITATDLIGVNGSGIATATNTDVIGADTGDAGNIEINLGGRFDFSGTRRLGNGTITPGSISSEALGDNASGKAGSIQIAATELALRAGAFISSGTNGRGQAGDITLNIENNVLLDGAIPFGPDFLSSGLRSSTAGQGDGGEIRLKAGSLTITNGANILTATIGGAGDAGDVILGIEDMVQIDGTDPIGAASRITASSARNATGNGGDIRITANNLEVTGGAALSSSLNNTSGRAGSILLDISETVRIQGSDVKTPPNDRDFERRSGIVTNIQETGSGSGGDIVITASNLIVAEGGSLDSSVLGQGEAGDIVLDVTETARFEGVAPDGSASGTTATVASNAQGTGGNLVITAANLEVLAGAQLQTSIFGTGEAGNILLDIAGTVRIDGINPLDSEVFSAITSSVDTEGSGNSGDIRLIAQRLDITEGAFLSSGNRGAGETGNIVIRLQGPLLLEENGDIIAIANEGLSGGNLDVSAQSIRLLGNSDILSTVLTGTGRGGNITLTADSVVALDDSDILAFSPNGRGGTIVLNTLPSLVTICSYLLS